MNKKVKNEELNDVNGGKSPGHDRHIYCKCGYSYKLENAAAKRSYEDGCSTYFEYQCPKCGAWNQ